VLNLTELRRAAAVIESRFRGHRLERWLQPGGDRLALVLYGRAPGEEKGRKRILLLSCRPQVGRVSELEKLPPAPQNPPAFVSWLRAHGSAARLVGVRILGEDRSLALAFEGQEARFELVLSLLGKRSNLYILDGAGSVVLALRSPGQTRPEMVPGTPYALPGSAVPSPGRDRFDAAEDSALLAAIESHYAADEGERDATDLAREIRKILKREKKNAERRLTKIEGELAEADRTGDLQREGELLKGSLASVSQGDVEVRLHDYTTGEEVIVALDPVLSPRQNLEAIFARYQKLLRRLTKAGGQVEQARAWQAQVALFVSRLEAAEAEESDGSLLAALAAEPEIVRMRGRRRAADTSGRTDSAVEARLPARLRGVPRNLHPRRYLSRDELEIWVGRSDEGNDYLTTRLARGKDLFFHLDGAPGSHVVLRTEGRDDPPPESVLDACELAVHFSKQKNAGSADVHVVPIKQVSKPRGAKRGLVYVTGGRSIRLRREESRLRRLLDARMEP
jgi:predicted ribosome quality control (RQC) complex YloA/Tae2 family protein